MAMNKPCEQLRAARLEQAGLVAAAQRALAQAPGQQLAVAEQHPPVARAQLPGPLHVRLLHRLQVHEQPARAAHLELAWIYLVIVDRSVWACTSGYYIALKETLEARIIMFMKASTHALANAVHHALVPVHFHKDSTLFVGVRAEEHCILRALNPE